MSTHTMATRPLAGPVKPWEAHKLNDVTFLDYYDRLKELCINMYEWTGLPDTVDERYLELALCEYGSAVYFKDSIIGDLAMTVMMEGKPDHYRVPTKRRAYAVNGFQCKLDNTDSVIIYNNYLRTPSIMTIILFAKRLTEIERTIDVNVKAQKTPVLIVCDESQRLTLNNLYKKFDGNEPVIFGYKDIDIKGLNSIKTDAPYVSDKLMILKRQIWNEAMTFFGIENSNTEKKERLVSDEITSNLGAVEAQRYIMLNARRKAAKAINDMFGTKIEVNFRQDFSMLNAELPTATTNDTAKELVKGGGEDDG